MVLVQEKKVVGPFSRRFIKSMWNSNEIIGSKSNSFQSRENNPIEDSVDRMYSFVTKNQFENFYISTAPQLFFFLNYKLALLSRVSLNPYGLQKSLVRRMSVSFVDLEFFLVK